LCKKCGGDFSILLQKELFWRNKGKVAIFEPNKNEDLDSIQLFVLLILTSKA